MSKVSFGSFWQNFLIADDIWALIFEKTIISFPQVIIRHVADQIGTDFISTDDWVEEEKRKMRFGVRK